MVERTDSDDGEQRREERYPFCAEAVLERTTGERIEAHTINVSGGGVLLQLAREIGLELGETVSCGVRLYEQKPLQSWGVGRVVRKDNSLIAIDFRVKAPGE